MNVTFIVGAGADAPYGMPVGDDFAKAMLYIGNTKENINNEIPMSNSEIENMTNAINSYYREKIDSITKSEEGYQHNFYMKYEKLEFNVYTLLKESLFKYKYNKILDFGCSVEEINEIYAINNYIKDEEGKIIGSIELSDSSLNTLMIKRNKNNRNEYILTKEGMDFVNKYPSYMGELDKNFKTLTHPKLNASKNYWKVIILYTRAYLYIVSKILDEKKEYKEADFIEILSNPNEVLTKIHEKTRKLVNEKETYYDIIANTEKQENINKIHVISTNYTGYLEECFIKNKIRNINQKISYVHGKIGWFESAYSLEVFTDLNTNIFKKKYDNDILFPYIFIQSGVKPIVESKQIVEWSKAIESINSSNRLYIIGYNLNIDDNHVNSNIREFLMKNIDLEKSISNDELLDIKTSKKEKHILYFFNYVDEKITNNFEEEKETNKIRNRIQNIL